MFRENSWKNSGSKDKLSLMLVTNSATSFTCRSTLVTGAVVTGVKTGSQSWLDIQHVISLLSISQSSISTSHVGTAQSVCRIIGDANKPANSAKTSTISSFDLPNMGRMLLQEICINKYFSIFRQWFSLCNLNN